MQNNDNINLYQTPKGDVVDEPLVGEIRLFSPRCRIGRLRYLTYITLLMLVFYGLAGALFAAMMSTGSFIAIYTPIAIVLYVVLFIISTIFMIQRLHDQDLSGWLVLLSIVPLANLILVIMLVFVPGTSGVNRFGAPPPPNTIVHWIIGLIGPVLLIVGILAAVAIPSYQSYVEKSRAVQIQ